MMKKELNENRVREFDEETAKVYEKLLNKIMKKKYNWFDKIDINQLTYSNIPPPYVGIRANIFVDEDWGGNQWREYNYSNTLPSLDEELSFGDIIGGDLAEELRDIFLTVFQMVTGLKIKYISFSWVDTYFVDLSKKNLDSINENKTVPVELKRRLHLIERLINLMLPNMYPCDYDNEETFVRGVIDEIYWLWHDEDYGVHDLNFGDVSDFILDYKREELSEYYNERCGNNLTEHIKKVLKEETEIPIPLRRRLHFVDEELLYRLSAVYRPDSICRFESGEELLDVIGEAAIDSMYWKYFSSIDDNSGEWGEMYYAMIKYIENKYGNKIKEYYHINCGN